MSSNLFLDKSRLAATLLICAAILGAACGGDAEGPTAVGVATLADTEWRSYSLVNSSRQKHGVDPQLGFDELICDLAREHSEAMRDLGFVGHDGPDGDLATRLRAAGVNFARAGENVGYTETSADPAARMHSQFMDSPNHRASILNPHFRLVGIGMARSGDRHWVTQIYVER